MNFEPMKKIVFIVVFFLLAMRSVAFAQGVVLEAFVDKPTVSLDDQLILTIRIKGASVFTEPRIPNRGNFDVLSRGSGSNVEMINGRLTVQKEYSYILGPRQVGTFTIGPFSVDVEGVEYKAGPISVTVTGTSGTPSGPLGPAPGFQNIPGFPSSQPPTQGPTAPQASGEYKEVFVTAEVDNQSPYVGEQVIYTFRLYTSRNVNSAKLELPDFHDFWSEEIQKENKYYKELGGVRYVVSEFKVALFPSKTGTLTVEEARLQAQVEEPVPNSNIFNDPFFTFRMGGANFRPRVFKAAPIEIQVKELPPGAPADFTGLVGDFKIESEISKKDLTAGETATLTTTVSGRGNIKDAQISKFAEIPNLKVYEDKPSLDLKKSPSGVSGTKTFKRALVPEAPGRVQIPPATVSYFDPKKGAYESLSASAYEVAVVPGAQEKLAKVEAAGPSASGAPVNPLGEDIATIHREAKLKQEEPSFEFFYGILIAFAAPPFIVLASYGMVRRQRWREEHGDIVKKKKALSKALTKLKSLSAKEAAHIPGQISHVMKEYLGDKLGMVGTALTPLDVEQIFSRNGKKKEGTAALVKFMKDLEDWQYGGPPKDKDWESGIRKKAAGLLKEVERQL